MNRDSRMKGASMNGAGEGAEGEGNTGAGQAVATGLEPPRRVWGWKEVAAELEVSVKTAQTYAQRNRDPLPVECGHRGPWAYASALRDWVRRQNVPYSVHVEARRAQASKAKARARRGDTMATARAALAAKRAAAKAAE